MRAIRTHVALSVRLCVGDDVSSGRQTRVVHLVSDCGGAHIGATWRIREIDLCDGGDAGRRYHYYSCCCCCSCSCDAEEMVLIMELRRHTPVNWFVSPIYLVGVPSALPGPIVCWHRPSNRLQSAAGPSQSPDPPFATVCSASVDLPSASENVSVPGLGP